MIGLYYLPLTTICHELNYTVKQVRAAFLVLSEFQFCEYDEECELVFVFEMARHQIGETIKEKDKRKNGIVKQLELYRKTPLGRKFLTRYEKAFFQTVISKGHPETTEGASKGLPEKKPTLGGTRTRTGTGTGEEPLPVFDENADQTLFEIAKAYPKLSHLENEMEIPSVILEKIIRAVEADGAEKVLRGTKAYTAQLKDREFALAPERFFSTFEYRAHLAKSAPMVSSGNSFVENNR
jgi:hypothetical protein